MNQVALNFIDLFVFVANGLIVVNILVSWFPSLRRYGSEAVLGLSDVILSPARMVIKPKSGLDWSPLLTIIALQLVQSGVHSLLS